MESSAITRRNSTSRRVQTLSSDSGRSDEIAATDIALSLALSLTASLGLPSRAASRVVISDMAPFWLVRPAKSIGGPSGQFCLAAGQAAVTGTMRAGIRII